MKPFFKAVLAVCLLTPLSTLADSLQINGVAAFEQLRKEYYIGALYLPSPTHDAAAVASAGGDKRMVLHITADRWSPMQFAQHWNQMILINNGGAVLNANVMDVLSFTSALKGDLVAGDELVFEQSGSNSVVAINGTPVVRASSTNLFKMLLNTWVGARPPTSEFKRDILNMPNDKAGADLLARFESVKPNDARKKTVSTWGVKEKESEAVAAATPAAQPATTPGKPKTETPPPAAEPKAAEVKKPAAPEKIATSSPSPVAAPTPVAPVVDAAAEQAKRAEQQQLFDDYSNNLRRTIYKNIRYPKRAVKQNREGLVVLKVAVSRDGQITGSSIAQSADEMLDEAALDAIKASGQLPAIDSKLEGSTFSFMIPVVFKLTDK